VVGMYLSVLEGFLAETETVSGAAAKQPEAPKRK